MLRNILSSFFRKIGRRDIYSLINLIGLSIGIAACLLIFLYLADELRFDRHHENAGQVYRMLNVSQNTGAAMSRHPAVLHDYLDGQIAEVKHIGRVLWTGSSVVNAGNEALTETGFAFADPSILDILTFEFVRGDPSSALAAPHSIILTEEAAQRYFGDRDPMGKTLLYNNQFQFVVSGVIRDIPRQSHMTFSMLASMEAMKSISPGMLSHWQISGPVFYLSLIPGADAELIGEQIRALLGAASDDYDDRVSMQLQPLLDVRLGSGHIHWEIAETGDRGVVMVFSVTALLILFLACFNFVNLSTAGAVKRSREVGIRKVLGASKGQLMRQFLTETLVVSFFAMLLALLLVELALPLLNHVSGKELSRELFYDPWFIMAVAGLLIGIPLLAGSYPASIMSGFQPVSVMKGVSVITTVKGLRNRRIPFRMRQLLLLLQFAVSTALIVGSLMIFWQMRYLYQRHPGYNSTGLMVIENPYDDRGKERALWLREQLLQHPDAADVSLGHHIPPQTLTNYSTLSYTSREGEQSMHTALISIDDRYFDTMESRIVQGRDFLPGAITEHTSAAIINQAAAARMGINDPTGMQLGGFYDGRTRQIVGVVEDIHFSSLHERVHPMAFFISEDKYPQNWFYILVRYNGDNPQRLLGHLEQLWEQEAPQWPLKFSFVDEQLRLQYQDDQRVMTIVVAFSILAIMLSVLGLIGLSVYASATRTREIGIRKVLGASVREIIHMVTSEFGVLVVVSNLIAWPLAYVFVNRWLDNFAYQTSINWLIFVVPALAVYLTAVLIVGTISYRAARMNPVESLRNVG